MFKSKAEHLAAIEQMIANLESQISCSFIKEGDYKQEMRETLKKAINTKAELIKLM